jgi:hypothetical protein
MQWRTSLQSLQVDCLSHCEGKCAEQTLMYGVRPGEMSRTYDHEIRTTLALRRTNDERATCYECYRHRPTLETCALTQQTVSGSGDIGTCPPHHPTPCPTHRLRHRPRRRAHIPYRTDSCTQSILTHTVVTHLLTSQTHMHGARSSRRWPLPHKNKHRVATRSTRVEFQTHTCAAHL